MKNFRLDSVADVFLPRHCVCCKRELLHFERDVCTICMSDLPFTHFESMSHNPMADLLNSLTDGPEYAYATALFHYRNEYCKITPALKYGRNFSLGRHFSSMLGEKLSESELFADVDCVIPIPLHWMRRWRRGYNQAEVIARKVKEFFPDARLDCRSLKRARRTRSQTKLSPSERAVNLEGAFRCVRPPVGSHILLVDDVFTTGNTLASAIRVLRLCVGRDVRISVATLALA